MVPDLQQPTDVRTSYLSFIKRSFIQNLQGTNVSLHHFIMLVTWVMDGHNVASLITEHGCDPALPDNDRDDNANTLHYTMLLMVDTSLPVV